MATTTLDARGLEPGDRTELILSTFRRLGVGQTMELLHDHEPKPLFTQLRVAEPGSFTWLCTQAGPPVWRVQIGRLATWGADGPHGAAGGHHMGRPL